MESVLCKEDFEMCKGYIFLKGIFYNYSNLKEDNPGNYIEVYLTPITSCIFGVNSFHMSFRSVKESNIKARYKKLKNIYDKKD